MGIPDALLARVKLRTRATSTNKAMSCSAKSCRAKSPFYADFGGLPPTLVHVGSWERLRDDSITVVGRMKAAGVAADLKIFEGMCHGWQLYAPMLDEGMASIEEAAAFITSHQTSRLETSRLETSRLETSRLETSRLETSRLAGRKSGMPSFCQVGAPARKRAF
jgi:hypothetical protein